MNVLTFVVEGCEVVVDLDALTGAEWRDAKQATGLHQIEIVRDASLGDFDAQAALVWLRLRTEVDEPITYEQVLARFSYATVGGPVTNGDSDGG